MSLNVIGRRYLCLRGLVIVFGPSLTAVGKFTSCGWAVAYCDRTVNNCDWGNSLIAFGTALNAIGPSLFVFEGFSNSVWAVTYCNWEVH